MLYLRFTSAEKSLKFSRDNQPLADVTEDERTITAHQGLTFDECATMRAVMDIREQLSRE